ncbi:MAG: hypothetical protein WAT37_16885 [Saprospiraceae bacterium]
MAGDLLVRRGLFHNFKRGVPSSPVNALVSDEHQLDKAQNPGDIRKSRRKVDCLGQIEGGDIL